MAHGMRRFARQGGGRWTINGSLRCLEMMMVMRKLGLVAASLFIALPLLIA
jgi:hypothetical protein